MENMRPTISWLQKKLSKFVNRVDIDRALEWHHDRGKAEGIVLATKYCLQHGDTPVLKRWASPGVQICDQCQLDAYITRSFEQGPTTGPVLQVSSTGAWRSRFFELRPDLKTHDVTAKLKAIKTSEIEHLLRELKKRTG
jgi:hypothetical protein